MSKYEFVNPDSFKQAVAELEQERVQKEIRDYFTFQADPEQTKVWQRYLEIEAARKQREREERKIQRFYKFALWTLSAICFYSAYQTFQR
jgi:hypothetical protein